MKQDANIVDARQHAGADIGNIRRIGRQIRAHVGDGVDLEREEAAVRVEREPRGRDVVAAVGVAEEMLGAVGDPGHRLAGQLRGDGRQRIFAIGEQLGAEAAADIGRDHPHLFGRETEHLHADDVADGVAALAAERQRVVIARVHRIRATTPRVSM